MKATLMRLPIALTLVMGIAWLVTLPAQPALSAPALGGPATAPADSSGAPKPPKMGSRP